jgi:hypothetical protein
MSTTAETITPDTIDTDEQDLMPDGVDLIADGTITSIVEPTEASTEDEAPAVVVSAAPEEESTDDDPIVQRVKEGMSKQRLGVEDQNSGLIMICEAITEANATGDGKLKDAVAAAMGKKRSDAELTWRGNLGKLLALKTDITNDPVRIIPTDDATGEPIKEAGAAYFKGRLRKYCQQVAKAEGVKPAEVMDELIKESNTLQAAIATIEAALGDKHATVIENLFSTGSVTKALKMVRGDEPMVGDLDQAILNAEQQKVLLDEFLAEAEKF